MPIPVGEGQAPNRVLLRDEAYSRLLDAIVTGVLEPGEQLREPELETWLGISRTPIREALLRLQHARLVIAEPGRSTTVAPLDPGIALQTQGVLGAILTLAVHIAAQTRTAEELQSLRAAAQAFEATVAEGDRERAFAAAGEVQSLLLGMGRNFVAICVVEQFGPLLQREKFARFDIEAARRAVPLVRDLVEAIATGSSTGAHEALLALWPTQLSGVPASGGFGLVAG